MKKSQIYNVLVILVMVSMSGSWSLLGAQEVEECLPIPLSKGAARDAIAVINANYYSWDKLSIDGKVKSDMIPMGISPSIKIFMEKDKKVQISLRAPFVGEVGQVQITPDSLVVVNKFSKTYAMADLKRELPDLPLTLGEIQAAILGRIIIPGKGELSKKNMGKADISLDCDGGWLVYPDASLLPVGVETGYITYTDGRLQATLIEQVGTIESDSDETAVSGDDDASADSDMMSMLYSWEDKKYIVDMEARLKGRVFSGTLSLDNPVRKASELKIKIPNNYNRVGFSRILKVK